MSKNTIGVGVIGASTLNPGWAMASHIPAIQALPDFELRAASTSSKASAEATGQALGVPAFDNPEALINHPDVDLVVVAVKVPHHHKLTVAALNAGKMVFTEWPLGRTLEEAEDLAARADKAGVRTVIGLQARFAPAVQYARDLIAQGYIGDILATNLVGTGMIWGDQIPRSFAYTLDLDQGAGVLPVPMLHALEAVNFVLGNFVSVDAAAAVRRPTVRITEEDRPVHATAFDHIALSGALQNGAIVSVLYRGAPSRGDNLRWEINGTKGDLVLTAVNGNFQVADLKLQGAWSDQTDVAPLELPETFAAAPGGLSGDFGANTLREYAALARDLRDGTRVVPDFVYAVQRHKLVDAIHEAARTGSRQKVA
jgi:predicted dehydrogenase